LEEKLKDCTTESGQQLQKVFHSRMITVKGPKNPQKRENKIIL
jgi:hypothetical protein